MSKWEYGLLFNNAEEFLPWLQSLGVFRINSCHVHHTYIPNHSHFKGNNHRALQDGMRNSHVNGRGWDDIGQHITIFPDGKIMTGRSPEKVPCSATGYNGNWNAHTFMFEMIGDFDEGQDKLEGLQLHSALQICRYWYKKGIHVTFHRECLINGKEPKSCPGTGIKKEWFMDLVTKEEEYMMKPEDANKVIAFLGAAWNVCKDQASKDEFNRLANEIRKSAGIPVQ